MTPSEAKRKAKAAFKSQRQRIYNRQHEGVNHLFWDTSMTLADLEYHVDDWIRRFGQDAKIIFDVDYYSSDSSPNYYVEKIQEETDDQYAARMKLIDEQEAKYVETLIAEDKKQTDKDLKEFERLKKRLEKKGLV